MEAQLEAGQAWHGMAWPGMNGGRSSSPVLFHLLPCSLFGDEEEEKEARVRGEGRGGEGG